MGLAAHWRAIRCSGAILNTSRTRCGYRSPRNIIAASSQAYGVRYASSRYINGEDANVELVNISQGTFYRDYPSPNPDPLRPNPPLFPNTGFAIYAPAEKAPRYHPRRAWCIVGPSLAGKTTFLQVLRGDLICQPPNARLFNPLIEPKSIRYAGFDTAHRGGGLGKLSSTYLAERYESRQESGDFTLRDYLLDNTELNPLEVKTFDAKARKLFHKIVAGLKLSPLLDLPVSVLSNGQTRRAVIAHSLLQRPRMLLLDEPFMGLDPPTVIELSNMLNKFVEAAAPLAENGKQSPVLVLTARPQDPLPSWITHIVFLTTDCRVALKGSKEAVMRSLISYIKAVRGNVIPEDPTLPLELLRGMGNVITRSGFVDQQDPAFGLLQGDKDTGILLPNPPVPIGETIVEMDGCTVKYGEKPILGEWTSKRGGRPRKGLYWRVKRGERWGVFGPNGSGKTTLLSLICSDHPQSYSQPIKLFGRSRLPDPQSKELPLTFWDIQERIGHSSPEVHQHIPRGLTVRQVLERVWLADTFHSKAKKLDDWAMGQIDATLAWFAPELNPAHGQLQQQQEQQQQQQQDSQSSTNPSLAWANTYRFGELSFSAQRVLLFLRAIIKHPDIVILDEAFSGMDTKVMDKCMRWLEEGNCVTTTTETTTITKTTIMDGNKRTTTTTDTTTTTVNEHRYQEDGIAVEGLRDHQVLICTSHVKEEVPDCVNRWMCLPEATSGLPNRIGKLEKPLRTDNMGDWYRIWGLARKKKNHIPRTAPVISNHLVGTKSEETHEQDNAYLT